METHSMNKLFEFPFETTLGALHSNIAWAPFNNQALELRENVKNLHEKKILI